MITLYPEKLLSIITISSMEDRLVSMFKKYGVSGFTILRARGEGSSGYEADISGFDSNILVTVIVSEKRMEPILESIARKLKKGYHLTTYISDVQVIAPDKFN